MSNTADEPNNAYNLIGQVAVVTGASGGIGQAIAHELARGGAKIVASGNANREGLQACVDAIQNEGGDSAMVVADLSQSDSHASFVDACWEAFGSVDAWLNIAGADVLTGSVRCESFDEKLARLWQVDVLGTIRLSRLVGDRMRAGGGGTIVNMGWDQAAIGQGGDSGEMFSATKGAIMSFSLSLARSIAPEVRVNCLAPGWIQTAWGADTSGYWDERAKGESLLERWGEPADVARMARFLVSPAASFINGQIVPINGGATPWPNAMARRKELS